MPGGYCGHALGPLGVALGSGEDLVPFAHIGEAIVQQHEDVGGDLLAQPVTRAEVLVDPYLHGYSGRSLTQGVYPRGAPTQAGGRIMGAVLREIDNRTRILGHRPG